MRALRKAFGEFDVRVVVFLRNQLDWLSSLCAEEQKWYGAPGTVDWYREHLASDHRLDYHTLCARWAEEVRGHQDSVLRSGRPAGVRCVPRVL